MNRRIFAVALGLGVVALWDYQDLRVWPERLNIVRPLPS